MRKPLDVEFGLKHPVGEVIERRAAATVRKWVTDPVEQAEVLEMLALDHVPDPAAGDVRQAYTTLAHAIVAEGTQASP